MRWWWWGWVGLGWGVVVLDLWLFDCWWEMLNFGICRNGFSIKICLIVLCVKNFVKKDFFRFFDFFVKIVVDGFG